MRAVGNSFMNNSSQYGGRKSRELWAAHEGEAVKVTGWECLTVGGLPTEQWWCPKIGYTCTVGMSLFETRIEALNACIQETEAALDANRETLAKLKAQLREAQS